MRLHDLAIAGVLSLIAVGPSACGGGTTGQPAGTGGVGGSGSSSSSGEPPATSSSNTSSGASGSTGVASSSSSGSSSSGGGGGSGGASTSTTSSSSAASTSATSGAGTGGDGVVSDIYPAPFPAPPQVISAGGPVLTNIELVPVFFGNEAAPQIQAGLTSFLDAVGTSSYWQAVTGEYGVGVAPASPDVVLTESAPATIDDVAIQTWLAGKLNGNDPLWPKPFDGSVYVLHYPAGTTVTVGGSGGTLTSCVEFGAYHDSITLDAAHLGTTVAYVVVPRCQSFDGLQGLAAATAAESRALVDTATAPYANDPAYAQVDADHLYWSLALGGEVGDLCAQNLGAFGVFPGLPYTVQRSWSNQAALAGHDPCVPEPAGEVYFNAVPELGDSITVAGVGTMKGVKIPVGTTKTIPLDLYSEGDTGGAWDVVVTDFGALMGGPATLSLFLDNGTGQNGQKLKLSITSLAAAQSGFSVFMVKSTLGQTHTFSLGLVGN